MNIPTLPFPLNEIEMLVEDGPNTAVYNKVGRRVELPADALGDLITALVDAGTRLIRRRPRNGQCVIDVVEHKSQCPGLVDDVHIFRADWGTGDPLRRLAGYNPKCSEVLVQFSGSFLRTVVVSVEAIAAIEAAITAEPDLRNGGRIDDGMITLHCNHLVDALPLNDREAVIAASTQLRGDADNAHQRRLQEAQSRPPMPTRFPRNNPATGRFMRGGDGRRRMRL